MSKVSVSTIEDRASGDTAPALDAVKGSARAWVNFDGANNTIRDDYNVDSVTDNGTGDYTVNFTAAMPNTSYSVQIGHNRVSDSLGDATGQGNPLTTTSFDVQMRDSNDTLVDASLVLGSVFGGSS